MSYALLFANLLCSVVIALACLVVIHYQLPDWRWKALRVIVGVILIGAAGNVLGMLKPAPRRPGLAEVILNFGVTALSLWAIYILVRRRPPIFDDIAEAVRERFHVARHDG